jgi:hypothetical protein
LTSLIGDEQPKAGVSVGSKGEQSPFRKSPIEGSATGNSAAPQPPAEDDPALARIAQLYIRHRRAIFTLAVVLLLLGFNGQWIVERDTSLLRGLDHSLATGKGYVFGEFATRHVYPGLPFILAGLEMVFGETAFPAIVLMNLMGLGVVFFTYRIMRLNFPEWIAIAVTAGVGFNCKLLSLSQELMTDVPFLFGVVWFIYGWERIRHARSYRQVAFAGFAHLLPGLVISFSMRPTCWILALACLLVCAWGVIVGPRRKLYATCLVVVTVGALLFFYLDPRTRGFNPLGGGYERDLVATAQQLGHIVATELPQMIFKQLAPGFFGQRFGSVLTPIITLALIGSTWFLFRRGFALGGLIVLITLAVTVVTEAIPRYYLMIVPLLMLGYVLMSVEIARRLGPVWGERAFMAAVALLVIPNVASHISFVYEQHWEDPGKRIKFKDPIIAAEMLKDFVPEDAKVIGPYAPIIAYLSGRQVYMQKELFSARENPVNYPKRVAAKGIEYMILPATKYNQSEPTMADLVEHGVIVPTARVTRDSGLTLAMVDIVVPPEGKDWRKNPLANHEWVTTTQRGPTSDQLRRMARQKREAAAARERQAKNELKAKLEAKRAREARERQLANAAKAAREAKARQAANAAKKAREAKLAREARARQAANARRLQRLRQQAAATQPFGWRWDAPASEIVRGVVIPKQPVTPGTGTTTAPSGP